MSLEGGHIKYQISSILHRDGKMMFMAETPNTVTDHKPKGQGHSMSAKNGGRCLHGMVDVTQGRCADLQD